MASKKSKLEAAAAEATKIFFSAAEPEADETGATQDMNPLKAAAVAPPPGRAKASKDSGTVEMNVNTNMNPLKVAAKAPKAESEAVPEAQSGAKAGTSRKTTRAKAKAVEPVRETSKAPEGGRTIVFSFRANPDDVTRYKAYAKARQGVTLAEIGAAAMDEYMARHKLTDAEAAIYDLEIKKADMLKGL